MAKWHMIICVWVVSVFVFSFNTISGAEKRPYSLSISSFEGDSVLLKLFNNTSEPAYLFDSYLNEYDIADVSYIHRYNRDDNIVKVSFLPFLQFLRVPSKIRDGKVIVGEDRYLTSGQIFYHFTKIEPGDCLTIALSKKTLTSDGYYYDVNLKSYTHLDENNKLKKELKLKQLKEAPVFDEITIELAVYRNIDLFLEKEISDTLNYKYIRMGYFLNELDEVTANYDIVTCILNMKDLIDSDYQDLTHQ